MTFLLTYPRTLDYASRALHMYTLGAKIDKISKEIICEECVRMYLHRVKASRNPEPIYNLTPETSNSIGQISMRAVYLSY